MMIAKKSTRATSSRLVFEKKMLRCDIDCKCFTLVNFKIDYND